VGQMMTPAPTCVSSDVSALDLVRLLHDKGFRHLLVTEGEKLVGIISDRDVIRCFGPDEPPRRDQLARITTAQLMSRDVVTVRHSTPVRRAIRLMLEHGISCLPVVGESRPVGIFTSTDVYLTLELLLDERYSDPTPQDDHSLTFAI